MRFSICIAMSSMNSRITLRFLEQKLTHIQDKGISIINKQLHAAVVSQNKSGTFPDETYGDILHGFTKWINEDFKAVFQHLLTQERIEKFSSCSPLQLYSMVNPLLYPLLPGSLAFSIMLMISTTTLQPPTNRLYIVECLLFKLWCI